MSDNDKMLERVRALLAKAASTEYEAEAELFRAKADELMTKYAIAQWQVEAAQAGTAKAKRPEPVARYMDFQWYWKTDQELAGGLWGMFLAVAGHCRCVVAHKHAGQTIPVVGLPADLDYMDMLFTHLFMQMVAEMDPSPKPGEPFIEALVRMKEAGLKWDEIASRFERAGYYEDPATPRRNYAGLYTRYCQERGRERVRVMPTVYRRSFASGFSTKVKMRLRAQREEQGQGTGSMALALRDIGLVVRDKLHELYPDQAKADRGSLARSNKIDHTALGRGAAAGERAEIISNAAQLRNQKELPR